MSIQQRRESLESTLAARGIPLRPDSRLCFSYANNLTGPEWTLERVADECCLMFWLYNHTDYAKRLETEMNQHAHYVDPFRLRLFFKSVIVPRVKHEIIREHGGVPDRWPWLVRQSQQQSDS